MKIGDWLVVALTFFTGVAAGSFVYLNGFREIDIDPIEPTPHSNFEITVTNYGGCVRGMGCSSYRLTQDGSYIFMNGTSIYREGSITTDQLQSLAQILFEADLEAQVESIKPDFCESWVDGVDTTYHVTRDTVSYNLDTCGTTIDVDSDLIELLDWLLIQFREGD